MKKRWIVVLMLLVFVAAAVVVIGWPEPTVEVRTATLTPRQVEQTVTCTGAVEAAKSSGVFAPIACVLREVSVAEGQRVKKGDTLALVDGDATRAMPSDPSELMLLAAMPEQLTAPADGIVLQIKGMAGAVLEAGTPCAVLALQSDIQIRVAIREKDLRVLKTGMDVRVTGDGFQKAAYAGTLTEIASAARSSTGSGTVVEGVVTLAQGESDPSLRLGLTAKAVIITAVTDGGVVVPYEAVMTEEDGSYVYLLEGGCAHRRGIRVREQLADGVLLVDGDLANCQVITQPGLIRRDGASVTDGGAAP